MHPPSAPAQPAIRAFLTRHELARHLRVSLRTLDALVAQHRLPQPIRLTRKTVRWPVSVLERIGQDLCNDAEF